jgi:hypothetical protein
MVPTRNIFALTKNYHEVFETIFNFCLYNNFEHNLKYKLLLKKIFNL